MAKPAYALLLLIAIGASAAQAQNLVADKLKKQGLNASAEIWNIAGVSAPASNSNAKWTAFVPTDAAVKAFLSEMGLSMADLKARPGLAKRIVGSHLLLGSNVRAQEIFANGNTRVANTAARGSSRLLFRKAGGNVTVAGRQGAAANVNPAPVAVDDNKTVHVIDKVLYGDGYYPSFQSLCSTRAVTLSQFCLAAAVSGLDTTLDAPAGFDHTVFVPSNEAFIAAKLDIGAAGAAPASSAVADVLKYHVLAGPAQAVPALTAGKHETLLAGQSVDISYQGKQAFVNGDLIVRRNVFVGKAIVEGITQLLQPGKTAAAAANATAPAAAANTTAPAAAAANATAPAAAGAASKPSSTTAAKPNKGSSSATPASITIPKVVMTPTAPANATAKSPMSTPAKSGHRKLLGFGWGASGGSTALADASTQQIQDAVDGDESVADAAQQSVNGAQILSVPGGASLADEGVYQW